METLGKIGLFLIPLLVAPLQLPLVVQKNGVNYTFDVKDGAIFAIMHGQRPGTDVVICQNELIEAFPDIKPFVDRFSDRPDLIVAAIVQLVGVGIK